MEYVLAKYVDKGYWVSQLYNEVEEIFIDNLTDFSYSTCFSYFIQLTLSSNYRIGSEEFTHFLKEKKEIIGVMVLISSIAPYAAIKFSKYTFKDGAVHLHETYSPLNKETERISERIIEILNSDGIQSLEESILNTLVPNVSLELKEKDVTIFNCLFEDNY
ncbi:hypothetical protein ACTSEZ_18255 [Metabacillus sp. JX24]|uniref:hypothetical protein n=1 Tax=Metabacillus sp. JX24 TaxID=3240759 RepID=UPI00350EE874